MKGIQLHFSAELIREALNLDESYDIIHASFNPFNREITLLVTGPDLPEAQEGAIFLHGHIDNSPDAPKQRRHIIPD